jgi:hypothetical protein
MSFSNDDDVTVTSSTKSKEIHVSNSTPENNNPPEGKTTAIVAVIRGKPKKGYHHHSSNKQYKKKLVRVLLDSGSDGELVFIDKDNTMLLPYSKRLVPQLWNTSKGVFHTKHKARVEHNFFDYSDIKRYYAEPDVVKVH